MSHYRSCWSPIFLILLFNGRWTVMVRPGTLAKIKPSNTNCQPSISEHWDDNRAYHSRHDRNDWAEPNQKKQRLVALNNAICNLKRFLKYLSSSFAIPGITTAANVRINPVTKKHSKADKVENTCNIFRFYSQSIVTRLKYRIFLSIYLHLIMHL